MTHPFDSDVAIVGGGPVGLGLAIDLALRGIKSRVLERTTELHNIPKGQNLTQRTGEHFRAWGVSCDIRAASPIPADFGNSGIVTYGNLLSDYRYDWFQRAIVRPYYFADNERLPQYDLERVLRTRAATLPEIIFDQGALATNVVQDGGGVNVVYEAQDGLQTIRAKYAVGCDGARSRMRNWAGIEQDIDEHDRRMVLLVIRSMELHELLERYPGKAIFNVMNPDLEGYWQFLGRVDLNGGWFLHAPVPKDTTADNFDFKAYMHKMVGREFEMEFEYIGFWDLRISLAKTYQNKRLFIAGDAAHSHPPYGGYGVNTGLEDARNLSWKLAASLHGWAGKDLIASYGLERRPVFTSTSQDFIAQMIRDFREFAKKYAPEKDKAAFEAAWARREHADDREVTEFLPHYAGSPIVFGQAGAKSGAKGTHDFVARAGYHLAPQTLPSGQDLWDGMGTGFALIDLIGADRIAAEFQNEAERLGLPLTVLSQASADLRSSYGAEMLLVRPDQFVAWAGNATDAHVASILARARGEGSM
jgi:2-polyprenyl-6-methoxyphenol hydroxylase-like FAD-dependent oxidoreductase